jgi:hypothetical protein
MKNYIYILIICLIPLFNSCNSNSKNGEIAKTPDSVLIGRKYDIGVFIPKDDASQLDERQKYMWVGRKNPIASNYNGSTKFINLWTDNGSVDTCDYYLGEYCITPVNSGIVQVFSIHQIWNGTKYDDTIKTTNSFIAINPPNISIIVTEDDSLKDFNFKISFVNSLTMKLIGERYEVGRMYDVYVYDNNDKYLGRVEDFWQPSFNFGSDFVLKSKLKKGYRLKIGILVRDTKTDLLIPTNETMYTIK